MTFSAVQSSTDDDKGLNWVDSFVNGSAEHYKMRWEMIQGDYVKELHCVYCKYSITLVSGHGCG